MCSFLLTVPASAGLALILLATSPANSITITTPAGARLAVDELDLTEAVHCRRYPHRHRRGHGWSRGCQAVTIAPRSSGVVRGHRPLSPVGRPPRNYINTSNPQSRSGSSNPQGMTQPRAINPQDMR
jgi:hypothetical protein